MEFAHKSSPRKKTAIKNNSTVPDREPDTLSGTVEFFLIAGFFLGELLYANSAREVGQGHSTQYS